MPRFDVALDALESDVPLAGLATKIGLRRESLRIDGEIALGRAIVEQALLVYSRQFAAYIDACDAAPADAHNFAPPSLQEVVMAQEGLRKMVYTAHQTLNTHAIPKEAVVQLVHRVRAIVQSHVPDEGRQKALLAQIGAINLPY